LIIIHIFAKVSLLQGIDFEFIDFRQDPIDEQTLQSFVDAVGWVYRLNGGWLTLERNQLRVLKVGSWLINLSSKVKVGKFIRLLPAVFLVLICKCR
jgi:hypothetical protein